MNLKEDIDDCYEVPNDNAKQKDDSQAMGEIICRQWEDDMWTIGR